MQENYVAKLEDEAKEEKEVKKKNRTQDKRKKRPVSNAQEIQIKIKMCVLLWLVHCLAASKIYNF